MTSASILLSVLACIGLIACTTDAVSPSPIEDPSAEPPLTADDGTSDTGGALGLGDDVLGAAASGILPGPDGVCGFPRATDPDCASCAARCDHQPRAFCSCDESCDDYGDCCDDYDPMACGFDDEGGGGGGNACTGLGRLACWATDGCRWTIIGCLPS